MNLHNTCVGRRLAGLLAAMVVMCPCFVLAQAIQIQVVPAVPAQVQKPAAEKPAEKADDAKPGEKPADKPAEVKKDSVDPVLENEIANLKKEMAALKEGSVEHSLKAAELKRKERELQAKVIQHQQKKSTDELVRKLAGGLVLDTDDDTDQRLAKAREFAERQQYREAVILWQFVLDKTAGILQQTGVRPSGQIVGQVLRPVRDIVEAELAGLPPDGLAQYRISADVEVRGLLASARGDQEAAALNEVVLRFFLSSLGDDAAYRLACLSMDQGDFVTARRLFDKLLTVHPDPSMSRADLLIRHAIASGRAGDGAGAALSLVEIRAIVARQAARLPDSLLAMVEQEVARGAAPVAAAKADQWLMAFGGPARDGVMAGLPGKPVEGKRLWTEQAVDDFEYKVPQVIPNQNQYMGNRSAGGQSRREVVTRWEKSSWMPAANVLLRDGRIYFKTHTDIRWYDLKTRKLIDSVKEEQLKIANGARVFPQGYSTFYRPDQPQTPEEISMFGDRIAKAMTLVGDTLYHIEGRHFMMPGMKWTMFNPNGGRTSVTMPERLVAVDVSDAGKGRRVRWRYPDDKDETGGTRILAAPTPLGDRLLLPVVANGDTALVCLAAGTGNVLWTRLLGTQPGETSGWGDVGVAVVEAEAYVATGAGAVFSIDAGSGDVLWASRYQRSEMDMSDGMRRGVIFGRGSITPQQAFPGFDGDAIIPRGDKLLITASDSDSILCMSRIDGRILWQAPRSKASYCLGVLDDSFYVAGPGGVRRHNLATGKREAETQVKIESLARGALTPQGVYMPLKSEILRLDPLTLKTLGTMKVAATQDDPVGNIFCDGDTLAVAALDRVYTLVDGEAKMVELNGRIAKADDAQARLDRAFLHKVAGNLDLEVEDLRAAHKLLKGADRDAAGQKLLVRLLELASQKPADAIALYEEAERVAQPLNQQVRVWLAMGRFHIAQGRVDQGVDLFLRAAQDTTDALVLVEEEGGRREARAALAAGAEVRQVVSAHPALASVVQTRGEKALASLMELVDLERQMASDPGKALPSTGQIQKLEAELSGLDEARKQADAKVVEAAKQRTQVKFQHDVEKATPTGKLDELTKKLADADVLVKKLSADAETAKKTADDQRKQVEAARSSLAALLKQVNELKSNRPAFADRLLALAVTYPQSSVAIKANAEAARQLGLAGEIERAELVLRDMVASTHRPTAAAGHAHLAQLHQKQGWDRQAYRDYIKLKRDFADEAIDIGGQPLKASEVADKAIASFKLASPIEVADRRTPDPPYEKAWSESQAGTFYMLDFDDNEPSQHLEQTLLMVSTSNAQLACRDLQTGKERWSLPLNSGGGGSSSTVNGRLVAFNNFSFPNNRINRDGHVGLLWTPQRYMAVGLVTGKKLWEVNALDLPDRANRAWNPYGYPLSAVAIGGGTLVEFGASKERGTQQVRALDACNGAVRWLAEFDKDNITGVAAGERYVIVYINNGNEAIICDNLTGQRLGRAKFESRQQYHPIFITRHGLLSTNNTGVTQYELPSGKKGWTASLAGRGMGFSGSRMDMIDENRCLLVSMGAFVVDLRDGSVQSLSKPQMGQWISDAAATPDGKEVYVQGQSQRGEQLVSVVETDTGNVRFTANLGVRYSGVNLMSRLAAAGDLVPVLVGEPYVQPKPGQPFRVNPTATLAFLRKSDGKRVDVTLPGGESAMKIQNGQSPVVRGEMIIIGNWQSMTAYRRVPGAPAVKVEPVAEKKPDPEAEKVGVAQPRAIRGRNRVIINRGQNADLEVEIVPGVIEAAPAKKEEPKKEESKKEEKK